MTLANTIVAETVNPLSCAGIVVSLGHNIDTDGTCTGGPGDRPSTDPLLASLGDYGGPTRTRPPTRDIPAIDNGSDAACTPVDQRGLTRPHDGNQDGIATCDVGAVEYYPPPPITP